MGSRTIRALVAALATGTLALAACSDDTSISGETSIPDTRAGAAPTIEHGRGETPAAEADDPSTALYQECLDHGAKVNLIGLPATWVNYQGVLQSFRDRYPGVENPVAFPEASSQDQMDAVQTLSGDAERPDSVEVGVSIAQHMVDARLFDPYVLSTDAQIPVGLKDVDRNWTAAYFGVVAIIANSTIVDNAPTSFADLAKPDYRGLVALRGDPRSSGSAFAAVMAASLANGGSPDDIAPGIAFFSGLKQSGNLVGTNVTTDTVISGETPITLDWSYNAPGVRAALEAAGLAVDVSFPDDGLYGGFFADGMVRNSPHSACSKLWLEHLLSDEGALGYLDGGAIPARIDALVKAGTVTDGMKGNLPPDELLSHITFLTPAQFARAKAVLAEQWGPMVADA